jgi:hypothetical protein
LNLERNVPPSLFSDVLEFCLLVWMKCEFRKIKVDTPDELLSRSLLSAACTNKRAEQLRQKTSDLHTPVVKCTDFDGGIFEHVL